jgi:xanthine dehydrogenase accessory factor
MNKQSVVQLPVVLIKGAGEHATGTAHRLFNAGFPILMTEISAPTCVRRLVSFASVMYDNQITVEGVTARKVTEIPDFSEKLDYIPVIETELYQTAKFMPSVTVDARIAKYNIDNYLDEAPLTIAMGPAITAGVDVDLVIETNRGHDLGRIISEGLAFPDTCIPGTISGVTKERVLRAPADGIFTAVQQIGDMGKTGDVIGHVAGEKVTYNTDGVIRGLIHDGIKVTRGLKIGDVDPRGKIENCSTLSDKTRTISGAVLEAICNFCFNK